MPSSDPKQVINEVRRIVEEDRRSEIRLNANGGNSILVICEPASEINYIEAICQNFDTESFEVIDLNRLLIDFVDQTSDKLNEIFGFLKSSVNQVFKAPANENADDYFSRIISAITEAMDSRRIPILINTGALYGAGIDNIQIMEHEAVMKAKMPLVILYPATIEGERINYLGRRPASRYRCMIVA